MEVQEALGPHPFWHDSVRLLLLPAAAAAAAGAAGANTHIITKQASMERNSCQLQLAATALEIMLAFKRVFHSNKDISYTSAAEISCQQLKRVVNS